MVCSHWKMWSSNSEPNVPAIQRYKSPLIIGVYGDRPLEPVQGGPASHGTNSSLETEAAAGSHTSSPFFLNAARLRHLSESYKKQRLLQLPLLWGWEPWDVQKPWES